MALHYCVEGGNQCPKFVAKCREVERLREALTEARKTIYGLVDQQAMPDDWWEAGVKIIDAALAAGEVKP